MAERISSPVLRWYSRHYRHVLLLFALAILLALAVYGISSMKFMRELEDKTLDFRFRLFPRPAAADTSIVMVAIDQGSLDYAGKVLRQGWPWPREFYAVVTSFLAGADAASLTFDILFDEADFDRGDMDSELSDAAFADALRANPNAVLSMIFTHDAADKPSILNSPAIAPPLADASRLPVWQGIRAPYPVFADAAASGAINLTRADDATLRRVPLFYHHEGKYYPSLALAAYMKQHQPDWNSIPYAGTGELSLNWYGPGGPQGVFRYIPFSTLLQCALAEANGFTPPLPLQWFKGRHVLIGATATGLMDLKSSPYTWGMPGMEAWATQLSNLLNADYLRHIPALLEYLILVLVSLAVMLLVTRTPPSLSLIAVILMLALLSFGSGIVFGNGRIVVNFSAVVFTLLISWLVILTLSYVMEGRHKRELRLIFNRYLHPDLVQRIVDNPDLVKMGGETLQVSVMFSDIYNFTTFSENKSPDELVSYLNEYFHTFTNSILDHNGLLDKYTGDGLMAVFGAPLPREDHALLACRAALAHRAYSAGNTADADDAVAHFHLNTRLGIASGTVVSGNIGSERRMEYTSIGDTVNLASRLEGVNKVFRTHIIICENTWKDVRDALLCRELDFLRVKGKTTATRIFELLGEAADSSKYPWLDDYAAALALYRKGDFLAAAAIFERLAGNPCHDAPSATMLLRCQRLAQDPPPDWDGIFTLDEK